MKLAVFFPGIGYHCDKPLLYYSGKIAAQYRYETIKVSYEGLSRELDRAFTEAFDQTRKRLSDIDFRQYEEILFVSKSIGTAVAAAYAEKYGIVCRNVYYTPLEQTFAFHPQSGIVFHGTKDPWAGTEMIAAKCGGAGLPLYRIDGANHSLEVQDDVQRNLSILAEVMEHTEEYIAK